MASTMASRSSPRSLHGPPNEDVPLAFDVGVAIAKKKKAQQRAQQQQTVKEVSSPKSSNTNASLRDFLYGASLYIACLALPTLLGLTGLFGYRDEQSSSFNAEEPSYYDQASTYVCENWWSYWCTEEETEETLSSVHAPDAEWTDVGIVAVLSLSMAMIRVLLVHLLVPRYLAPKRLEALVRCKSVSLLSSSYQKSLTPQGSKRTLNVADNALPPPPLFTEEQLMAPEQGKDELSSSLHGVRKSVERYILCCYMSL